jgi:hypothetical protein
MTKTDKDEPARDGTAAQAAAAETLPDDHPDKLVTGTFAGVAFSFKRKRLDAVQFTRNMQARRSYLALEWLLGADAFNDMVAALADEDGVTSNEEFLKIYDAIGEAAGTGNSSGSSG